MAKDDPARMKPPPHDQAVLAVGTMLALKNARRFVDDATLLLARDRYSSAVMLSTSATEEIGRFGMLESAFRSLVLTGTVPEDVFAAWSKQHLGKLKSGLNFRPRLPASMDELLQTDFEAWRDEATRKLQDGSWLEDLASETNLGRMAAQYLGFDHEKAEWVDPSNTEYVVALNAVYDAHYQLFHACCTVTYPPARAAFSTFGEFDWAPVEEFATFGQQSGMRQSLTILGRITQARGDAAPKQPAAG